MSLPEPDLQHRAVTKRAVRMDKREVDFIASTEAVDAHGTIVKQNWDLKRFSANPVILWAHDSDDMPLGRGAASVVNGQLLMTVTFATADINPKAEQVLRACDADMVRGMSVGFRPNRVTYDEKNDVFLLDENELYEASICPVPSNPESLRRSLRTMATRAKALDTQVDIPQDGPRAPQAPQETKMDPKQLEEMTTKLEARATEIASLKTNLSALEARAVSAEARVTVLETEKRSIDVELTAMKGQNERLVTERDTALERATAAEKVVVRSEVTALIGRKIDGGELEAMIELRTENPAIFEKLMKQRKDMNVLEKALKDEDPLAGPPAGAPPPPSGASGELYEDFERQLKADAKTG